MIDTTDLQQSHQNSPSDGGLACHLSYRYIRTTNITKLIDTTIKSGLAVAIYLLFLREMDDNGVVLMTRKQICNELNASMMGTGYAINVLLDRNLISIKKIGRNHIYEILP